MAIRENATVKVINGFHEGKTGKVVKIHDYADIAVVSFDDNGDLGKVLLSELVEVQPQKQAVEPEIPEGAKRITKKEFITALEKVVSPEAIFAGSADPLHAMLEGLSATLFGHKMAKTLFEDKDAVILTEDDLVGVLWNTCNPVTVVKEGGGKHSTFNALLMSTSSVIVLRDLVTILFDKERE